FLASPHDGSPLVSFFQDAVAEGFASSPFIGEDRARRVVVEELVLKAYATYLREFRTRRAACPRPIFRMLLFMAPSPYPAFGRGLRSGEGHGVHLTTAL